MRKALAGRGVQIRVGYATGAAANTAMTITGIKPGDEILSMLNLRANDEVAAAGPVFADVTATATVSAADAVKNTSATNGATGRQILVIWASSK